jgi:hypothetical protein
VVCCFDVRAAFRLFEQSSSLFFPSAATLWEKNARALRVMASFLMRRFFVGDGWRRRIDAGDAKSNVICPFLPL